MMRVMEWGGETPPLQDAWNTMRENVMRERGALPPGWVWTTLGEITDTTRMRADPQDHPDARFIGMEHVETHTMRLLGTVPAREMRSSAECFKPGDVLYGRLRPYLNKVLSPDFAGLCSGEFIIFRKVPHLENRYLQYFLNSADFVSFASHLNAGDRPRVNFEQLADYPFPLSPLPDQHRIVAEIEKQFTRLDAGVSALKRVQANLKRYRASVLRAACEGRLAPQNPTDEPADRLLARILAGRRAKWEAEHPDKRYVEPAVPVTDGLPELPEGWCWAGVEQACDRIVDCLHSTPVFSDEGRLCVDSNCIEPGRIVLERVRYVDESTFEERNRRMTPVEDDVIFSREGALLGIAVRVPAKLPFCLGQRMMIFRPSAVMLGRFFEHVLNSSDFRSQYRVLVTGTAAPHLNIGDIRLLAVPLPPLSEQHRIVAEVERRLSVVAELEATVAANLARAGRLRQAVLKRAFEGRLAPQDPNDEPASVMLERIRATRGVVGA
jgi:type I restriction enzyme, S subunit